MIKKKNRVKHIRTRAGITQRELAAKAGTYYQQVQRIETHQVEARLDLAIRLSKALGKTLDEVFPGAGKALVEREKNGDGPFLPPNLNEYGIETDTRKWDFKFLLKGHRNPLVYEVPVSEKRRIHYCTTHLHERAGNSPFIVFDTNDRRVALNLNELQGWQFLFDVDAAVFATALDQSYQPEENRSPSLENDLYEVNIFFVGNPRPWSFSVDHDEGEWVDWYRVDDDGYLINADGKWIDDRGKPSKEGYLAKEHDEGQLRYILELMDIGGVEDEIYSFEDEDGETAFFRPSEIALFEVPLAAIEPWDTEEEDETVISES